MSIGFIVFLSGLIVGIGMILFKYIFKKRFNIPIIILSFSFSLISLISLSIIPYMFQLKDTYEIKAIEKIIIYHEGKIEAYEAEDKKVLEIWAEQQKELTQKLSSIGVQFADSIQPNNIIKKLSDEIVKLHNKIDEYKIDIYYLESVIERRKNNKFYWGF